VSSQPETLSSAGIVRRSISLERFPWIRRLVSTYAEDFASVAPLFAGDPASPAAWRDTIARVQRAPRDRTRLAEMLGVQLTARGAPAEALAAAAALTDPRAVAIVTGQQAGLFGGPLYTLLKAVTAIQLARKVREEHGVPAVPVFWVDGEDHDWEEVRTADVLDADFAQQRVTLGDLAGAGSLPVARLRLDDRVAGTLDELRGALAATEFTPEVFAALARHYRPGAAVGTAFAGWLDELLGRHGVVVFEADDPAAKPLAGDVFTREISQPGLTSRLARDAGAAMAALGHAPQVAPAEDAVALFYLGETGRVPIRRKGADFLVGERAWPAADLQAEAARHPDRFSPNVLLRPVVQDRLFPNICYVSGPSELAYLAQLKGIYGAFGVEAPLLYSRASATLVDSGAMRFLDRHDLPFEDLHTPDESALNRLLESQLPATLEQAMSRMDEDVASGAERLAPIVAQIDPTLAGAVETTRERMQTALKTLQAKIVQASKRKDETLRRQFERTRVLAFPGGVPQERALCIVFFANRYGHALADRLIDGLPLDTTAHYLLAL
jgi:bacillithiol biosynthesis cysteine-adding enzyme BshC